MIQYIKKEYENVFFHHRVLVVSGSTISGNKKDGYCTALTQDEIPKTDAQNEELSNLRKRDKEQEKILHQTVDKKDLEIKTIDLIDDICNGTTTGEERMKKFVEEVHKFMPTIVVISFLGSKVLWTSDFKTLNSSILSNIDIFMKNE